jgi:hypothetical protein
MQRLKVSCAVRPTYGTLGAKGYIDIAHLLYKMLAFVSTLVLHFCIPPGCNKRTNITMLQCFFFCAIFSLLYLPHPDEVVL